MTHRILAATDLSAPSRHAVDRAYRLAAERGWQLHLAHAIPPGLLDGLQAMLGSGAPSLDAQWVAEAEQRMCALNQDPQHARGIVATCEVLHG